MRRAPSLTSGRLGPENLAGGGPTAGAVAGTGSSKLGIHREIGQRLHSLQEREQELQAAAEAIRNLDRRRLLVVHLLETIQQSTSKTPGLWLSRLHLDSSELLVSGLSLQSAPVAALVESLRQSPMLKQIQLHSRSQRLETGVWEFEMKGQMKAQLEADENE